MPPRQGHRKSRTGCTRCKSRKVKCDEVRPVCSGCARYPHRCVYPTDKAPKPVLGSPSDASVRDELQRDPSIPSVITPYSDLSIEELEPDRKRVLELLLLHTFSFEAYRTFAGFINAQPADAQRWVADAVSHALQHDFLLHALFAVSALYLVLEPASWIYATKHKAAYDFARIHRMYLNVALREQNDALSNVNGSNAEALCWASYTTTYVAIGQLPEDSEDGEWTPPVQLLSMQHGTATVHCATAPFLAGTPVREYSLSNTGPEFTTPSQMYNYAYTEPLRSLLTFDDGLEIMDPDISGVYDKVIAYISRTYEAIATEREQAQGVHRRLSAFGAMVPKQFIDLVSQERPRALAILAHHFAMVKCMDRVCWFRGLAERHVFGIQSRLPPQWQWAMEWPLKTFEQFSVLRPPTTVLEDSQ